MTDKERNRAFRKERAARARRKTAIQRDTAAELRKMMRQASKDITALLAAQPSDFELWQLPVIQKSINGALAELGETMVRTGSAGMTQSWQAGLDLIDEPIAAGGVRLAQLLPEVDTRQLFAMRSFFTDRMRNVSLKIADRVNTQVGLVALGAETPTAAVNMVASLVESGRGRAVTVIRTELGRAFSVAGQQRLDQAREILPGLRKQWRRSGKVHSRIGHDLADGQIVATSEAFTVNGFKLKFPRDPSAPAKETINCGCTSLPLMESWEVRQPGRAPFSDDELRLNPRKRDLAGALSS